MGPNRHRKAAWAVAAALCLLSVAQVQNTQPSSAPAVTEQRIAALVAQLGDDSRTNREQAASELAQIGLPAMDALRQAAQSGDAETAHQARLLRTAITQAALADDSGLFRKTEVAGHFREHVVFTKDLAILHDRKTLRAVSLADGKQKWTRPALNWTLLTQGDTLICWDRTELLALDVATGEPLWQRDIRYARVMLGKDCLFCIQSVPPKGQDGDSRAFCLSMKDGSVLWELAVDAPDHNPLTEYGSDDICLFSVRVADHAWKLVSVEPASGKKLWEAVMHSPGDPHTHCYNYASGGGRLYVFYHRNTDPNTPPNVCDWSKTTPETRVYDLASGKRLETDLAVGSVQNNCTVADGRLLFAFERTVVAHDIDRDYKTVWSFRVNDGSDGDYVLPRGPDSGILILDGTALLAVRSGLLALDIATGKPMWKFPTDPDNARIHSGPVARNGIVYFTVEGLFKGSDTGRRYLYALDVSKAKQLGMPEK